MKKYLTVLLIIIITFVSVITVSAADADTLNIANELYKQGLLNGTGVDQEGNPDFDLDSPLTREQAATLLVKLIGAEADALAGAWNTPFIDVSDWAKPYVGYAFALGITQGISGIQFGAKNIITASQYITFILKALGFDASKDFTWNKSWELSDDLGITNGEYNSDNDTDFLRADAIRITYETLQYKQKSETSYITKLFEEGSIGLCNDSNERIGLENNEEVIQDETPALSMEPEKSPVYEGDPNVVAEALKYKGYPYKAGGKGPSGFDCSGFCIYILKQCGYSFTAGSSQDLYNLSSRVSESELQVGDLVFFKGTYATDKVSHSGIYIGNGQMIHAANASKGVLIDNLSDRYWSNHFYTYGRMTK